MEWDISLLCKARCRSSAGVTGCVDLVANHEFVLILFSSNSITRKETVTQAQVFTEGSTPKLERQNWPATEVI